MNKNRGNETVYTIHIYSSLFRKHAFQFVRQFNSLEVEIMKNHIGFGR